MKKDAHAKPNDMPVYILTQGDYDELREVQTMLVVMAQVSYGDEDIEKDNLRLMRSRSDINRFFAEVSAKLGSALDGLCRDHGTDSKRPG
jgi:hypothetical protein